MAEEEQEVLQKITLVYCYIFVFDVIYCRTVLKNSQKPICYSDLTIKDIMLD